MKELLSDTLENVLLNDIFNQSLVKCRQIVTGMSEENQKVAVMLHNTGVFLIDNPQFKVFSDDFFIVDKDENHKLIFMFKEDLASKISAKNPGSSAEICNIIHKEVTNLTKRILMNDNKLLTLTGPSFNEWLNVNELTNVAHNFGYQSKPVFKM